MGPGPQTCITCGPAALVDVDSRSLYCRVKNPRPPLGQVRWGAPGAPGCVTGAARNGSLPGAEVHREGERWYRFIRIPNIYFIPDFISTYFLPKLI